MRYQQQKIIKLEMENRLLREEKDKVVEAPKRKKKVERKTETEEKKPQTPEKQPTSAKKEAVTNLKVIKKRSVLDIEQRNTLLRIIQIQAL